MSERHTSLTYENIIQETTWFDYKKPENDQEDTRTNYIYVLNWISTILLPSMRTLRANANIGHLKRDINWRSHFLLQGSGRPKYLLNLLLTLPPVRWAFSQLDSHHSLVPIQFLPLSHKKDSYVHMTSCQPSFSWHIFIFSVASTTDPRIVPTKTELRSFVTTIKPWFSIGFTWHKKIKGLSREIPAEKCAIVVIRGKKIA